MSGPSCRPRSRNGSAPSPSTRTSVPTPPGSSRSWRHWIAISCQRDRLHRPPGHQPRRQARFRDALAAVSPSQGRFEYLMRGLIRLWCRALGWQTSVVHRASLPEIEGVPGAGCVVAGAPHRAWVEPFLLLSVWPRDAARLVWLADGRTVTRSRWRRRLLPRLGVIPIGGGPRAYAELAAQVLSAGHALAVFPEVGAPSPPDRARRSHPASRTWRFGAARPSSPS